eukprot:Mycagemm_TRINITY_DN10470_c0_g1::TRINITY_DN10470_c0_g1_i1::g.1491::m.1491 type:complete len:140 gc:universal TRINITY_DN10470_c0_g1_i1:260-679(+)
MLLPTLRAFVLLLRLKPRIMVQSIIPLVPLLPTLPRRTARPLSPLRSLHLVSRARTLTMVVGALYGSALLRAGQLSSAVAASCTFTTMRTATCSSTPTSPRLSRSTLAQLLLPLPPNCLRLSARPRLTSRPTSTSRTRP